MKRRMRVDRGGCLTARTWLRVSCALLGLFFAVAGPAQTVSQYDVEAADLYNFGKFVRWPADALAGADSFDICMLGQNPFGGKLEQLIAHEQMSGKPIRKRVIAHASEAKGCAIVYISESEGPNLEIVLAALNGKGALLVSGLPHFAEDGGAIQFLVEDNRVRFEVNLDAVTKNRLAVSSELLKVATGVIGKPQSGGSR